MPDDRERLESRESWHLHVEEHEMNQVNLDDFDCLPTVGSQKRAKSLLFERLSERFARTAVVVRNQDRERLTAFGGVTQGWTDFGNHVSHPPRSAGASAC